jgi:hypothetical protein
LAGTIGNKYPSLNAGQGLSIWAPTGPISTENLESYARTPFARDTGWDAVARKYGIPDPQSQSRMR